MAWYRISVILTALLLNGCLEPDPPQLAAVAEECRCSADVRDPYETPIRFDFGRFKGQCIDSCRFRAAHSLTSVKAHAYGASKGHAVIANFRHNMEYWIANVPVEDAEAVDILFEDFYHGMNHVALRFRFKGDGVVLYPQNPSQKQVPTEKISDLVLSIEGVAAGHVPYDVFNSSLGNYLLDYRVQSGIDTANWMVRKLGHVVRQYRLTMAPNEVTAFLMRGLVASERESFTERYQLLNNNCATAIMELLGDAKNVGWTGITRWPRGWPLTPANGTLSALRQRGLVKAADESRIENLRVEPESL